MSNEILNTNLGNHIIHMDNLQSENHPVDKIKLGDNSVFNVKDDPETPEAT